jgi:hypothetical protein
MSFITGIDIIRKVKAKLKLEIDVVILFSIGLTKKALDAF